MSWWERDRFHRLMTDQPFRFRLTTILRSISPAFNAGRLVELKLIMEPDCPYQGEMYIRVPVRDAERFQLGDTFSFKLTQIE